MEYSVALVLCGVGALLLRVGMAVHAGGLVRAKNASGILLRHLADLCIAALAVWAVGAAIAAPSYGNVGWGCVLGFDTRLALGAPWGNGWVFFAMAAVALAGGIVSGVVSERSRFLPMWWVSLVMAGAIVPLAWRWVGVGGWLHYSGYHDLAGASFIHMAGGLCAAVGAIFVGARAGKYNHDGSSNAIPGHNLPLATVGAMVMLVGWVGYVIGFVPPEWLSNAAPNAVQFHPAGRIAVNLLLAAAAGTLTTLLVSHWRYGKADIHLTLCGLLGALVAASAGADVLSGWAALLVGVGAGLAVPLAIFVIDLWFKIDDPTGGVAIHAVGGAWGVLAAGLLRSADSFGAWIKQVGVQAMGVVAIAILAAGLSTIVFAILRATGRLRASEADEYDGLDLAEHDIGAYPDFQQTMIKSYHLREM